MSDYSEYEVIMAIGPANKLIDDHGTDGARAALQDLLGERAGEVWATAQSTVDQRGGSTAAVRELLADVSGLTLNSAALLVAAAYWVRNGRPDDAVNDAADLQHIKAEAGRIWPEDAAE